MRPQAFLDGIRSSRGMGMGNTRMRDDRSTDQDQTRSGNPRTIFNQPSMRTRQVDPHTMFQGNNKMPPQSFHQPTMQLNRGVRPQMGQMQAPQPPVQQPMPSDPMQRMRFTRPMFRQ